MTPPRFARGLRAYVWVATTSWGWYARGGSASDTFRVERVPTSIERADELGALRSWLPLVARAGVDAPSDLVRVGKELGAVYLVRDGEAVARVLGLGRPGVAPVPEEASGPVAEAPGALGAQATAALGLLLLRGLTGGFPELPDDPMERDAALLDTLLELGDVSPELAGLLLRCLDADPAAHPSPEELRTSFEALASERGGSAAVSAEPPAEATSEPAGAASPEAAPIVAAAPVVAVALVAVDETPFGEERTVVGAPQRTTVATVLATPLMDQERSDAAVPSIDPDEDTQESAERRARRQSKRVDTAPALPRPVAAPAVAGIVAPMVAPALLDGPPAVAPATPKGPPAVDPAVLAAARPASSLGRIGMTVAMSFLVGVGGLLAGTAWLLRDTFGSGEGTVAQAEEAAEAQAPGEGVPARVGPPLPPPSIAVKVPGADEVALTCGKVVKMGVSAAEILATPSPYCDVDARFGMLQASVTLESQGVVDTVCYRSGEGELSCR